jgi:hypothetical protein
MRIPAEIKLDMSVLTLILAFVLHLAPAQARGVDKKAEALKDYAGRYELEVGLIPVSTLDLRAAGNEVWIKH